MEVPAHLGDRGRASPTCLFHLIRNFLPTAGVPPFASYFSFHDFTPVGFYTNFLPPEPFCTHTWEPSYSTQKTQHFGV